jgi:hypothetical protein
LDVTVPDNCIYYHGNFIATSWVTLLKSHKSPGTDQIPVELIKAGGRTIHSAVHKRIISIWNKQELPEEWKESTIVPIYKKGDKTDCSNDRGIYFCQILIKFYLRSYSQG